MIDLLIEDTWTRDALCAQTDPELFYPDKGESVRPAKSVCKRCPVRTECLQHALDRNEYFGIWGGLSPNERTALRHGAACNCFKCQQVKGRAA